MVIGDYDYIQCSFCGKTVRFGIECDCYEKRIYPKKIKDESHLKKINEQLKEDIKELWKEHEIKGEIMEDKNEEEIMLTESQIAIIACMDSMKEFLLEKNRRYGDSALHPKRVFSKATTDEQILVRLDDKISRIQNSDELRKNDICDAIGYLTLLCVAKRWTDFSDMLD
jgi:hypothetical protein